ncbi:MAG: hypothetical protein ACIAQZ_01335 [Sedimentisphaeraceae bacterium JB056]
MRLITYLIFIILTLPIVVNASSSSWPYGYQADALPSGQWSHSGISGGTVSAGILNIDTTGSDEYCYWVSSQVSDFSVGMTIELCAKVYSSDGGGATAISVYDVQGWNVTLNLMGNMVNVVNKRSFLIDTTDAFHTYRLLLKTGIGQSKLYVDDSVDPAFVFTITDKSSSITNRIQFGDFTSTNDGNWDIDYLRWILGEPQIPDWSAVYFSDFSNASTVSGFSSTVEQGKWSLFEYETAQVCGKMAAAYSFINAPAITVEPALSGWYGIYVGYWNPEFIYGGKCGLQIKLDNDNGYRLILDEGVFDSKEKTYFREIFIDSRDMTGRTVNLAKQNGLQGMNAFYAYLKFVPLTVAQASAVQLDRQDTTTRKLDAATIDGMSIFHYLDISDLQDMANVIEQYHYSDTARCLWALSYGDRVNYPSSLPETSWLGGDDTRMALFNGQISNSYIIGQKQMYDALNTMEQSATSPVEVAKSYADDAGIEFDIMFRLGITGRVPGDIMWNPSSYVNQHPEYRQINKDGNVVNKASYAFEAVRDFQIAMINEALETTGADGVNLCFVRGPHFLQYEQPVIDRFFELYGLDATDYDYTDTRLQGVWIEFMTALVSEARSVVDAAEIAEGREIELSVWVWPHDQNVWLGKRTAQEGLDVEGWITSGLVDRVICQEGTDATYMSLCDNYGCDFTLFTGYRDAKAMSPDTVTSAYNDGVDSFGYWDVDSVQIKYNPWNWVRRIGHQDEMANWGNYAPQSRTIAIEVINNIDLSAGLDQIIGN